MFGTCAFPVSEGQRQHVHLKNLVDGKHSATNVTAGGSLGMRQPYGSIRRADSHSDANGKGPRGGDSHHKAGWSCYGNSNVVMPMPNDSLHVALQGRIHIWKICQRSGKCLHNKWPPASKCAECPCSHVLLMPMMPQMNHMNVLHSGQWHTKRMGPTSPSLVRAKTVLKMVTATKNKARTLVIACSIASFVL